MITVLTFEIAQARMPVLLLHQNHTKMTPEIEKIFDLIAEDKLPAAFDLLDEELQGILFYRTRLANIQASYKKIEDDYIKGILDNEDYYAEKAEIRDRLLKLVTQLNNKEGLRSRSKIPIWTLGAALLIMIGGLVWIFSGKKTDSKLNFSGDWKIKYFDYYNCNHTPYNDNLELVYQFIIDHDDLKITGEGTKFSEVFDGDEKIYTDGRIPATLHGEIKNGQLLIDLNYLNNKDQDIIEKIVVQLDKESKLSFKGSFESEASNCKGKVRLSKSKRK